VYANRDEDSVIFKSELEKIAEANKEHFKLVFVYDNPKNSVPDLQKGMITPEKARSLAENLGLSKADEYFICGPAPMMENVKGVLEGLKVAKEKIHIEYFTAVADAVAKAEGIGANVKSNITVIQYGIETNFDLDTDSSSILDAAIDAGVDAPFSCKGAVCCTCRAKVIEGKVKMDANFALTDAEVADGYILTCQSHPLTERLIVDYDA
jgi:ring-1,2-phenylacetyl-CoA epoxidase subunit PaaE